MIKSWQGKSRGGTARGLAGCGNAVEPGAVGLDVVAEGIVAGPAVDAAERLARPDRGMKPLGARAALEMLGDPVAVQVRLGAPRDHADVTPRRADRVAEDAAAQGARGRHEPVEGVV